MLAARIAAATTRGDDQRNQGACARNYGFLPHRCDPFSSVFTYTPYGYTMAAMKTRLART